ncbi:MAG: histidine--tRNA ligase [Muribaculaceae bacterium]|nr:histidine--tRNA ligase [Muribaculaceae bacterium]
MAQKPSIPKGTRDFSTQEMARRNYIFDTIRSVFALYGYRQIETPAMENLSTLMGKYGEEGDKLLFKILNSGDFLASVDSSLLEEKNSLKVTSRISEKGLRYDLTVPFARFVVQHRDELKLPFKRFQIQPVWRADRPQKGRYREFYQCDADVVGSDSLLSEVELLHLIDDVFSRLRVRVAIKLNNRKVLAGIAELIGEPDRLIDITVAIDKIDKIGIEKVNEELAARGLSADAIAALQPFLAIDGTISQRLDRLSTLLADIPIGREGVEELRFVVDTALAVSPMNAEIEIDTSLARGLNYYTGTIIEVKALDVQIGSITGGGRYDNLTGVFGMPGISGVGISFGADRIYDVLNTLGLYPEEIGQTTRVMFVNLGKEEVKEALTLAARLRAEGVSAEVYPDEAKLKKQFGHADALNIPVVAIIGTDELAAGTVALKFMASGEQRVIPREQLLHALIG